MKKTCTRESKKEAQIQQHSPTKITIDNLPREIGLDILSRLCIKSLIQTKWVCKSWLSLARDPLLHRIHFSRIAKDDPSLLLHVDFPIQNYFYSLQFSSSNLHTTVDSITRVGVPTISQFFVVGSCNGLLCLWHHDQGFIYNPFTRDSFQLPKPNQFLTQHRVASGFGFCSVLKEYKVVRIVYYRETEAESVNSVPQSEIQVLTVKKGGFIWRNKGETSYQIQGKPSHVLVSEKLHWLSLRYRNNWVRKIICFDLWDEKLRELPSPRHGMFGSHCTHVVNLRGCLCGVVQGFKCLYIWVMKQYGVQDSWIQEFRVSIHDRQLDPCSDHSITVPYIGLNLSQVRVLFLLRNGNVLLEHRRDLIVFDPKSEMFKELVVRGSPKVFSAVVHIGSLNWIETPIDL